VLQPAAITGIIAASDPGDRRIEVPSAVVVGLLGLGLLARRRRAVWAGFALIPLSIPLTVAAFSNDAAGDGADELGVMMAGATVILCPRCLPYVASRALAPRRTRRIGR
jgi:MYXO-CTERM domain-containing protein